LIKNKKLNQLNFTYKNFVKFVKKIIKKLFFIFLKGVKLD